MSSSNLDIFRAIAVSAVLLARLFRFFGNEQLGPLSAWELGISGVLMFFVHTALVLMMSMERVRLTHLTDVPAFYVRRIARIYPLLAVTVLVAVCFQTPASPNKTWTDLTWRQIATNVVAVQNLTYDSNVLSVLWSLPLEVQMFALLPFMFLILRKSSGPGTVLGDMITRNHDRTRNLFSRDRTFEYIDVYSVLPGRRARLLA